MASVKEILLGVKIKKVEGHFVCNRFIENVDSLVGSPKEVRGTFSCTNSAVTTLKGGPQKVGRSYRCEGTYIKNLIGMPKRINEDVTISENIYLESLEGAPKYVGGDFDMQDCPKLKSFDFFPDIVLGDVHMDRLVMLSKDIQKQFSTHSEIKKHLKENHSIEGLIFFGGYDIDDDGTSKMRKD